jgi:hypothetical protein
MGKNKIYLLASFMGLIITTLVVSNLASAHEEPKGANFDPTRHEAMQEILTNRDYQAWKETVDSRPHISDYITEENFDQFVDMHELMMAGDREGAQEIRDELGLPERGMGMGFKRGMGSRAGRHFQSDVE